MQVVIDHIEGRRKAYERHDFLVKLLADTTLPGERRLAWAPSVIPFIMGYSDLNKYVFRKGEGDAHLDPLQALLNAHTYEEDFHWQWMLQDLEKLGADGRMPLSEATRVLWGPEFAHSRRLCLELASLAAGAPAYAAFAMVEAIEAVSVTIFEHCQGISLRDGQECEFFGTKHYAAEASHSIKSPEVAESSLPRLDDLQRGKAIVMADRVFSLFDEWSNGLLRFAIENEVNADTYARMVEQSKEAWPSTHHVPGPGDGVVGAMPAR
ncbi:hypothetical protein [Streptantibioticus ferralitis]|uniref:Thiaminase-2/PQQC domain-containing protein n=1 Tax=Streptantibioticus ferralitis TaxID=236510 RepID=A0ABT5ZD39_9ACTN|nr:hypothetical protein [Streptantibioticus ferralitis]MDF2261496.1 hypothetical protein [Streptantibioticus ferralitis]